MLEEWKFYKETYNRRWGHRIYGVSNLGNVKCNGKPYKCYINKQGYLMFGTFYVHRAVAELFISNPENKPCVDHKDTNKLNNKVDNLRWTTYLENTHNTLTEINMKNSHFKQGEYKHTEETKKKMSEIIKNQYKNGRLPTTLGKHLSEETKEKISKAHKGKTPWNKGLKIKEDLN